MRVLQSPSTPHITWRSGCIHYSLCGTPPSRTAAPRGATGVAAAAAVGFPAPVAPLSPLTGSASQKIMMGKGSLRPQSWAQRVSSFIPPGSDFNKKEKKSTTEFSIASDSCFLLHSRSYSSAGGSTSCHRATGIGHSAVENFQCISHLVPSVETMLTD